MNEFLLYFLFVILFGASANDKMKSQTISNCAIRANSVYRKEIKNIARNTVTVRVTNAVGPISCDKYGLSTTPPTTMIIINKCVCPNRSTQLLRLHSEQTMRPHNRRIQSISIIRSLFGVREC